MYCPQCGTDQPERAKFCNECGAALAATASSVKPAPATRQPRGAGAPWGFVVGAIGVIVGVVAVAWMLGNGDDAGQLAGDTGGGGPEDVAQSAIEAFIDGNEVDYLDLVRPDHRDRVMLIDLSGCDVGRMQFLAEDRGPSEVAVTVVMDSPCGNRGGSPVMSCRFDLVELSGKWYVFQRGLTDCSS